MTTLQQEFPSLSVRQLCMLLDVSRSWLYERPNQPTQAERDVALYADAPILGTFVLFPLKLIAVSFIMVWLTLRVRSFWPAVLMHGSGNGIEEGVVSSLTLKSGIWPLTGYVLQIGVTIALALICILLTPKAQSVSDANA